MFRLLFMIERALQLASSQLDVEVAQPGPEERVAASTKVRIGQREFDMTWTGGIEYLNRDWARGLAGDLASMRQAARENDSELVLLTYAWDRDSYRAANQVIRAESRNGSPVIDLGAAFDAICPDRDCSEFFFPDGHPTKLGYQIAAVTAWRELQHLHGMQAEPGNEASWTAELDAEVRRRLDAVRMKP